MQNIYYKSKWSFTHKITTVVGIFVVQTATPQASTTGQRE